MGIAETILETIATGIYSVTIFGLIVHFFPVKNQLAIFGIVNKWLVLAFLLFTFGYMKHEIGYYMTVESSYCKQTGVCENLLKKSSPTIIDKIKSGLGLLENVWIENAGEGVLFIIAGLPAFMLFSNKYFAAMVTGVLANLVAEYSGIHKYFCRTSCSVNPLVHS